MYRKVFLLIALVTMLSDLSAQMATVPFTANEAKYKPFKSVNDKVLTNQLIEKMNTNPQYAKLIKNKKLCIGVVDISDHDNPVYASINGDHMMYAASLPKIAILLAVMDAVDKKEVKMTPEIDSDLQRMIRYSDNQASTRMIDLVGYEKIASVLQDPKYELYNKKKGGGLWVGKRYASGGRRFPEPLKGLSHAATANQVCKFYYMLAYGQLVNFSRSVQMLGYMSEPGIHHKFVNCLDKVCPDADVYRKSGSWKSYHADSVLVIGKGWRSYILVALVEDPQGEQIIRGLLPMVEELLN